MSFCDFNHPAFRELTFGTGGIGKTTAFVERVKKQKARVIWIYDHKMEFCRKLDVKPIFYMSELAKATLKGGVVCYAPTRQFPGEKAEGFKAFCDFAFVASGEFAGRKIMVADELQSLHDNKVKPFELVLCMDDGRYKGLDCMFIAQGANQIFNGIRAQVTECYTFRQAEENAIKKITDYGFDKNEVRALRPGEWIWRNLNTGESKKGGSAFEINGKGKRNSKLAGHR